jgi:tetratricopeptide (TPR) repeat protein
VKKPAAAALVFVALASAAVLYLVFWPPVDVESYLRRGEALYDEREYEKAIAQFDAAIRLVPSFAHAHLRRAECYAALGAFDRAVAGYREAIRLSPGNPDAHNCLAWTLATCPDGRYRDGAAAVEHGKRACELEDNPLFWGTLGAAFAEAGRFGEAVEWQERASAHPAYPRGAVKTGAERLKLYRQGRAWRDHVNEVYP